MDLGKNHDSSGDGFRQRALRSRKSQASSLGCIARFTETRGNQKRSADLDKSGTHRLEEAVPETLRETMASTKRQEMEKEREEEAEAER